MCLDRNVENYVVSRKNRDVDITNSSKTLSTCSIPVRLKLVCVYKYCRLFYFNDCAPLKWQELHMKDVSKFMVA